MDYRTLAAAVLGVGLGLVLVAAPEGVLRAQFAGRVPGDRHGEYGSDGDAGRYTLLVRGLGVVAVLAGLYFGLVATGSL